MSLEKLIEKLEPIAFHEIDIDVLKQFVDPLKCWRDLDTPITVEEVLLCVKNGNEELVHTPTMFENVYGKNEELSNDELRQLHIKKVAFFVKNDIEEPIYLDVGVPSMGCYVDYIVDDGNHRLAGAIIKGQKSINCNIAGSEDHAKEMGLWNPNQAFLDLMDLYDEQSKLKKESRKKMTP